METELKNLVKEFFEILDTREMSDNNKEFSPVYISSCRVLLSEKLGKILHRMRKISNEDIITFRI